MTDFRSEIRSGLAALLVTDESGLEQTAARILGEDSIWDIAYPINRCTGIKAILERFIHPLRAALGGVHRRDEIFIAGQNTRPNRGVWAAALTHYVGTFEAPFLGIRPGGKLVFLRAGEFYRIEQGRIAEAKIIIDLPDLMRQSGRFPLPRELGTEMLFPGPATHDGVLPRDRADGPASIALVEAMLADLHVFDPETGASLGQTGNGGYWASDMLWYGPGGVGSNYRWEGFVKDHRAAFLRAFPDRRGGNHFCRIGDGSYAAVSGWPSMTMTHKGAYLGVAPTEKPLTLRVMDFYRCANGQIAENWVCLDFVDLLQQMGVDLIARSAAMN